MKILKITFVVIGIAAFWVPFFYDATVRADYDEALAERGDDAPATTWQSLGPAPIPIDSTTSYSGRVSAIVVHPTNPNIVYVGTAFGGLYRSLNGGTSWTPLMDNAQTLTIGSIAFHPGDPTTLFVGTGDIGNTGVGVYKITNADTTADLSGPFNQNASNVNVLSGARISKIVISSSNPNLMFLATNFGLYRTSNGLSANPVFQFLSIHQPPPPFPVSHSVVDLVLREPAFLVVAVLQDQFNSGVYLSSSADNPSPNFFQTLSISGGSASVGRIELAASSGAPNVYYAATGTANGRLYKGDGTLTWMTAITNGFCNPQCSSDMAVAVDPTDANKVFLGGSAVLPFGRSSNGGTSFTNNSTGLLAGTQAIAVAPSNPNIVYVGTRGGIWRTNNVNATPIIWDTLNNSTFSATQFTNLALHPLDRHYTLGASGTTGTLFLAPDGTTWSQSHAGDSRFVVIDQNAPNINNVTAYQTVPSQTGTQIGFRRATTTDPNGNPIWSTFYGCGGTPNGISCADPVVANAPIVRGPGNPNTLYFGTNRLYRSADMGVTMTDVSGALNTPGVGLITAIAIAPQNDNVRLAGTQNGIVFLSAAAGATTMTNVTGSIPATNISRIAIDPNNSNIAYVVQNNSFAIPHVWKTTNLLSGTPTWTAAGNGLNNHAIHSFVIDPAFSNQLFAGTGNGIFRSTNGGASWLPFNNGLPAVPVFGMEIQAVHRILKIATLGRGMFEYDLNSLTVPTSNTVFDFDGDGKSDVSVFRPSNGDWYVQQSTAGFTGVTFGFGNDLLAPADFDGDGRTDVSVFRPSDGGWYRLNSSTNTFAGLIFGQSGDLPRPGDYDGDGLADVNVFRPSDGGWYRLNSSDGSFSGAIFGQSGDQPLIADFDGDTKADIAVFRPSDQAFYSLDSSTGAFRGVAFGFGTDIPTMGDFDGDFKTDVAVFRPSTGGWYRLNSSTGAFVGTIFGQSGDIPVTGDYDGDGLADIAVFRPSAGDWYYQNSSNGAYAGLTFGATTDNPVPAAFQ